MRGLGHDVVDIESFAAQLGESGTRMRNLFSPRELRQAAMRGQIKSDGETVHLAARWAGKEAVIKAWCEAISRHVQGHSVQDCNVQGGNAQGHSVQGCSITTNAAASHHVATESITYPYSLDDTPWNRIEIIDDVHGCPHVILAADVAQRLFASTQASPSDFHISISHDAGIASAVVFLE